MDNSLHNYCRRSLGTVEATPSRYLTSFSQSLKQNITRKSCSVLAVPRCHQFPDTSWLTARSCNTDHYIARRIAVFTEQNGKVMRSSIGPCAIRRRHHLIDAYIALTWGSVRPLPVWCRPIDRTAVSWNFPTSWGTTGGPMASVQELGACPCAWVSRIHLASTASLFLLFAHITYIAISVICCTPSVPTPFTFLHLIIIYQPYNLTEEPINICPPPAWNNIDTIS